MPIDVFTGQPGNGKTSFMMKRLLAEAAKAERPLWAGGIDGLAPGLANVLRDPREWNAVKPGETCTCHDTESDAACTAHVIPNGSLIFVDEAWKWFGHLQDASRQATPQHVLALAEHRHRGLDFVWTTQMPNQLYPFVRGLIGAHTHCVRRFGTQFVDLFKWGELQEDVKSAGKRELAQRTTSALPKDVRGKYKSAEEHTIKARLPWKVWALPVVFVGAIVLGFVAYRSLRPEAVAAMAHPEGEPAGQPAGRPADGTSAPGSRSAVPLSPVEYVAQRTPRIESIPASAPIYDGRSVQQYPVAYCVVSSPGRDARGEWSEGGCTCYTQQATKLTVQRAACEKLATERGEFDPYQAPRPEPQQAAAVGGVGGSPPTVDGAAGAAPVAPDSASAEPVAAYGWFRDQHG